jgi:hypothetical protein
MSAILLSLTLLGAAAEVQTRETPTTRLFVQTTPPGATIKLDGKPEGAAPKVFLVPLGATKMIVEVELDGHASQRREVVIQGGRVTRIEFQLAPSGKEKTITPAADKLAPLSPRPRQTTTLVQGVPLEGTVTDRDGNPISGARVGQGEDRCRPYPYRVETQTDTLGRYRFADCNPGPLVLTVVAPGHSPELRAVTVVKDMKPVDFRLALGKTLRLRVVDTAGRPIAGAVAGPDKWL